MELGLSLGDTATEASKEAAASKKPSGGVCMDLRLGSPADGNHQTKSQEETDDDYEVDDADHASDQEQDFNREGSETCAAPAVQLHLLPPPLRRISPNFLPLTAWSSDNGSPENGSSENTGLPATRGFDVNRPPAPAAAIEAYKMYGNLQIFSDNKRAYEDEKTTSRASDEEENGINSRKKLRLSKEQSAFLEESFKEHHTLNPKQKLALANHLNLRPRQVEVWFQNRRARTKLKQTEVDCEYLRRCCETLTEENRRLQKELQELRALKASSSPFYAQLPATTLTMCPSCERVATASRSAPPPPPPVTKPASFFPFKKTPPPAASS
ncbi:homeobox-leucine zipper protein HOX11-like [Andrographis paniculata]|uniref:homeobox-leucine zipper protein HOX11-like n=1 Tax=Andrographis paniculata TaxID=175694 RepID=UPI0021E97E16|nr:homeobox-leucine zipper protein HOX11-like [Andrographis paniculata]